MTRTDDPRLEGRWPEFARMSRRPGIGQSAMHDIASTLMQFNLEKSESDVPVTLAHGTSQQPLGRYLRQNLRRMMGKDEKAPLQVRAAQAAEMLPLLQAAQRDSFDVSLKSQLLNQTRTRSAAMLNRARLHAKKRKL